MLELDQTQIVCRNHMQKVTGYTRPHCTLLTQQLTEEEVQSIADANAMVEGDVAQRVHNALASAADRQAKATAAKAAPKPNAESGKAGAQAETEAVPPPQEAESPTDTK